MNLLSDVIALDGVDQVAPVYQFHHCSTLAVCKQPQLLLLHPRYNIIKRSACAEALFSSSGPYSGNAAPPSYSQSHTLQAALQTETCNERQRSEKLRLALMELKLLRYSRISLECESIFSVQAVHKICVWYQNVWFYLCTWSLMFCIVLYFLMWFYALIRKSNLDVLRRLCFTVFQLYILVKK